MAPAHPPPLDIAGKTSGRSTRSEPAQIPAQDPSIRRAIITPGPHKLEQIIRGCKVWVQRTAEPEPGPTRAEILSMREIPAQRTTDYYVHYVNFNKRLDDWVPAKRLLLDREVEWPLPKEPPANAQVKAPLKSASASATPSRGQSPVIRKGSSSRSLQKKSTTLPKGRQSKRSMQVSSLPGSADASSAATPEPLDVDADGEVDESVMDVDGDDEDAEGEDDDLGEDGQPEIYSKEEEIEKLRTQGSMTQNQHEIARVRNLQKMQIGGSEVEAWYFSPYPVEYAHTPILYICEFCLSFFNSHTMLGRHRTKCTLLHPPGNEIYRHEEISFFEIDGRKQKTWCRNLCLLSKCFLDHKTLYYDVDPFLFYVMTKRDAGGCHLVGYFSKEKESADNYNVACILTIPSAQRSGYGKLLIEFSYELSKREQKLGSPEKPLSDLGLLSYRSYWAETIIDYLLQRTSDVSIDDIANATSITHNDIMNTCQTLGILKALKGQFMLVLGDAVIEQHEKTKKKKRKRINPEALVWRPPQFSREQLRFGF